LLKDIILSDSRDQSEVSVLILGFTTGADGRNLFPLTYPVQPAAVVWYPPAESVRQLLAGGLEGQTPVRVGTLIARSDVTVELSADLSDADARLLPGFGPGQGLVSGQAVRFPLLVRIDMDRELMFSLIGGEDFLRQAKEWKPDAKAGSRAKSEEAAERLRQAPSRRSRTGSRG
jgi:hypothetical protein